VAEMATSLGNGGESAHCRQWVIFLLKEKCSGHKIYIHIYTQKFILQTAVSFPAACHHICVGGCHCTSSASGRVLVNASAKKCWGGHLAFKDEHEPLVTEQIRQSWHSRAVGKRIPPGGGQLPAPEEPWAESMLSSGGIVGARREHVPRPVGRYGSPWHRKCLWAPCTVGSILTTQQ